MAAHLPPARHARLALGAAVGIAVATFTSMWRLQRATTQLPQAQTWAAVAAALRPHYQPHDVVHVTPEWLSPMARWALGDLMPLHQLADALPDRYARIWTIALGPAPTTPTPPAAVQAFAPLTLTRHEHTPPPVTWRASDHRTVPVAAQASPPRVSVEEVGFAPHRCLVTVLQGTQTIVRFPDATPAPHIRVSLGLADVFTRRDNRTPVELTLWQGATRLGQLRATVDDGLRAATFEAAPGGGLLRVDLFGSPERRICFDLEALP